MFRSEFFLQHQFSHFFCPVNKKDECLVQMLRCVLTLYTAYTNAHSLAVNSCMYV